MAFMSSKGKSKKAEDSDEISKQIEEFSEIFHNCLTRNVYDKFLAAMDKVHNKYFPRKCKLNDCETGPILFQLSGCFIDLDLLMEIVYEKMRPRGIVEFPRSEGGCLFTELAEIRELNTENKIPLIYLDSKTSNKYLTALLDALHSESLTAYVILFSNDSQYLHIPQLLKQSIKTEDTTFVSPQTAITTIFKTLVWEFSFKTDLILDANLLFTLYERFIYSRQSFKDIKMVVSASICSHLTPKEKKGNSWKKKNLKPILANYFFVLELATLYLEKAEVKPSVKFSGLIGNKIGYHMDFLKGEERIEKMLAEAKKIWRTSTKQVWTGFFEEFKKSAIALNKNEFYTFHQDDVAEVANKLSEMAEQVEKTKVVSREEQMRLNMNKSPARRKALPNVQPFESIITSLEEILKENLSSVPSEFFFTVATVFQPEKDENDAPDELQPLIEAGVF